MKKAENGVCTEGIDLYKMSIWQEAEEFFDTKILFIIVK